MFWDVNENDAAAAVKVWAQMLGRDRGVPVDPSAKILRGTKEIGEAVRSGRADAITMTVDEYWTLRREIPFAHIVVAVENGSATEEYVLLVHQTSELRQLADLRGRTLTVFQSARTSLATIWLETLLAEAGLGRPETTFSRVTQFSKLSRVVLPVFFHQVDACLVTRKGFATMAELNPQVGRQLKVLASSPAVVPSVFCFRADYDSPYRDRILAELGQLNATPAGQQFKALFQCGEFSERPASCLDSAVDLLERHRRYYPDATTPVPGGKDAAGS